MEITGERFIPGLMRGQIETDHLNRYYFASNIIDLTNLTVLDIASGSGYGSSLLAQKAGFVYGVDISTEAIEYSKLHYHADNIQFLVGDVCNIPITNNSIDLVVSFETIEHVALQEKMLSEIHRVLKPNGLLVISSPNKLSYSDETNYNNPFHEKELYTEEFVLLLKNEFSNVLLFEQNYHIGSVIYPAQNLPYCTSSINLRNHVYINHPPLYDIAIAFNHQPELKIPAQISYLENEDYISMSQQELTELIVKEKNILKRKSISWRLGNTILYPIKRLCQCFRNE